MKAATNQKQLVEENLKDHAARRLTSTTEKLRPPGIESLHLKAASEIGEVLANMIKSRNGVTSITYNIGQSIEITSQSDLSINVD